MKKTYNTSWNPFQIQYRVEDERSNQSLDFLFSHTYHSITRSSQRGIDSEKIIVALEFGEVFYSQGMQWYVLGEKNIPNYLKHKKNQQPEVRAKNAVSVKKRHEAEKQAKLASGEYVVAEPTAEGKRPKIIKKTIAEKKTQKTPIQQYNKAYYEQHKEKLNQGRKEYDAKRYKERKQQKTAAGFQHPIKPNYPPPPPPSYASLFSKSNWVEEDF